MNTLLERARALAAADSPSAYTVCVDFDGVFRPEGPWNGGRLSGTPLPGAVDRIRALLDGGWRIVFLTARGSEFHESVAHYLARYLNRKVVVLPRAETCYWEIEDLILVTNVKPGALVYLDDKAEAFTDWATALRELPDSPGDLRLPGSRARRWDGRRKPRWHRQGACWSPRFSRRR
ncbi:hypothetical protein [Kitasatospora griseola]|uniref:hypothetical protein n=1 Tax=Kitasatospora griseola TaxID=2064 RepID=UPI003413105B